MKSAVAVTKEIDDMRLAAEELAQSIQEQLTLGSSSCGLLYYDYEVEGDTLGGLLEQSLGIPVIGCSAIATLDDTQGYHEMEAMLMVLTADDCQFSVALSEPLTRETAGQAAVAAYEEALGGLTTEPRLLYALVPNTISMTFDHCLEALSEPSGRLPILGGINSSTAPTNKSITFGGTSSENRAALLVIGGNLRPVCSIANASTRFSDRSGAITRAENHVIHEVDGMPFADFLAGYGLDVEQTIRDPNRAFYQNYPLLVESTGKDADGVAFLRIIDQISADGSATAFADFPVDGAKVSLGRLERDEIRQSVESALGDLLAAMEAGAADGYRYTTVLCVSCAARHLVLTPNYEVESGVIQDMLPEGVRLGGFYSHGELCPTSTRGGWAHNRLHNGSIVFCAF